MKSAPNLRRLFLLTMSVIGTSLLGSNQMIPSQCEFDKPCKLDIPGAVCGDGTQTFIEVTFRSGGTQLLIHLDGGGFCFDAVSCGCADGVCRGNPLYVGKLTRPLHTATGPGGDGAAWWGMTDPKNPFDLSFDIVEVPYCTGDEYLGNNRQNYGTSEKPMYVNHYGNLNLQRILGAVRKMIPSPDRVVFTGSSAGGIGATYQLHKVRAAYPNALVSLVSDSGLTVTPQFYNASILAASARVWGSRLSVPSGVSLGSDQILDGGDMVAYNAATFPGVRYGLLQSRFDSMFTYFGVMAGQGPFMVSSLLEFLLGNYRRVPNVGFFVMSGTQHTFLTTPPSQLNSDGRNMGDWVHDLIFDTKGWP